MYNPAAIRVPYYIVAVLSTALAFLTFFVMVRRIRGGLNIRIFYSFGFSALVFGATVLLLTLLNSIP